MLEIRFEGGEGRMNPEESVNYMIAEYEDKDGEEQELYAEVVDDQKAEPGTDEYDEFYGYDELKDEIIYQAEKAGLDLSTLKFFFGELGSDTPIKAARTAAGITQQRMSELMDIPKRTIESWEQGGRSCLDYVERLVKNELNRLAICMSQRRYIVVDDTTEHGGMDQWHKPFMTLNEANEDARDEWSNMTKEDRKHHHIYVATVTGKDLESNCFEDGKIIDWDGFFQYDLEGFDSDKTEIEAELEEA